jgi:hypothetical protein
MTMDDAIDSSQDFLYIACFCITLQPLWVMSTRLMWFLLVKTVTTYICVNTVAR